MTFCLRRCQVVTQLCWLQAGQMFIYCMTTSTLIIAKFTPPCILLNFVELFLVSRWFDSGSWCRVFQLNRLYETGDHFVDPSRNNQFVEINTINFNDFSRISDRASLWVVPRLKRCTNF